MTQPSGTPGNPRLYLFTALFFTGGLFMGQVVGFMTGFFLLLWFILIPLLVLQLVFEGIIRGIFWSLRALWRTLRGLPPPPPRAPPDHPPLPLLHKAALLAGLALGFGWFWFGQGGRFMFEGGF